MNPLFSMRPATLADKAFADDLLFMTMHEYVEATWPNNRHAHQQYYKLNSFDPMNTRILLMDNRDIGRLSTTKRADCIFIDELHILPEYQGLRIGTSAIEAVIQEAREAGLPVKLMVLTVNPAYRLYLRMGFRVIAEEDHRFHMEYAQT